MPYIHARRVRKVRGVHPIHQAQAEARSALGKYRRENPEGYRRNDQFVTKMLKEIRDIDSAAESELGEDWSPGGAINADDIAPETKAYLAGDESRLCQRGRGPTKFYMSSAHRPKKVYKRHNRTIYLAGE